MDPLLLSRIQFGDTAAFHILWPLLSIGLALFMFILEAAWLKTGNVTYYRQVRFWSKIFILTFGIGTASGFPLEFEFGTNWAAFSQAAGDFFGNILGFESTVAFALEAAFLGIFVFGWHKVPKGVHLFSNGMVCLGATLSAFWIMVANSWMQVPLGVVVENGKLIVSDYMVALFNHNSIVSFLHMEVACIETTLFFIMGLCAWKILALTKPRLPARKSGDTEGGETRGLSEEEFSAQSNFFMQAFKWALGIAIVVTPLQIGLGDISGQIIASTQPAKLAATELHWETNAKGSGADWVLLGWPQKGGGANAFQLTVPDGLSILTTHSTTGTVEGLNAFPESDRPTIIDDIMVFYSFRIMVGIGFALFALMLIGSWYWWRGKLDALHAVEDRWFLRLFAWAIPLGFIATEAGWMVREIGRQPWVVYHLLRTSEAVSPHLSSTSVASTLTLFTLMYLAFGALFIYYTYKIMKKGPNLTELPLTS